MDTLPLKYLSRSLAPAQRRDGSLATWTPKDGAVWVLESTLINAALHRLDGKTATLVAAGRKALGLPEEHFARVLFTGADGELRVLLSAGEKPAAIWRLDGRRFVEERDTGFVPDPDASFVHDARSGRLFHVSKRTGRVAELKARAFEDAGALGASGITNLLAGWDAARGALVALVDSSAGKQTIVLKDGKADVVAADVPGAPRYGMESFPYTLRLAQEPATGRALLLRLPPSMSYAHTPVEKAHVLGEKGWEPLAGDPAPHAYAFVSRDRDVYAIGAGRVPVAVETQAYNYAPRREWATFDGKTWASHGRIVPEPLRITAQADPPLIDLGGGVVARINAAGEVTEPMVVEGLRMIVGTPDGPVAATTEGVVTFAGGAPKLAKAEPPAIVQRAWAWHAKLGALLAIGGKDGDKPVTATHALKDGTWSELKTKGKPHKQYAGLAAYDAARGVVVLAGGFGTKTFEAQTAEFDGKTWHVVGDELPWHQVPDSKAMAFDEKSGQLFAVIASESDWSKKDERFGLDLFRYAGDGVWEKGGELRFEAPGTGGFLTPTGGFAASYDPQTRRVLCAGPVDDGSGTAGVLAADIGALLDSWPRVAAGAAPKKTEAKPLVPVRRLRMTDDGANKFWIAELSGKSWTARWGKRGTDGDSKTYKFDTAEKAAKDFSKKVQEKIDKGYRDAAEGEDPSQVAGRHSWEMKIGKPKKGADHVYGLPPLAAKSWPACRSCGKPMEHLATLLRDDERLPLEKHAALAVFMCDETGCKPWDPDNGGNAVLLVKQLAAKPSAPDDRKVTGEQGITWAKPKLELDPAKEPVEPEGPGGSKVGGFPTWVQDPEIPVCNTCKKPMRFVAQLDHGDTGMNFGDVGIGYVFACADEHAGKFLSQSS